MLYRKKKDARAAKAALPCRQSGGSLRPNSYRVPNTLEHDMRKFHSIAALCGDGLRPELKALFDRLAIDPHSELFVRSDGMTQSGPDPMQGPDQLRRPYFCCSG
jgi:hypothetical protein